MKNKKKARSFSSFLTNNIWLKILALAFAVIIWSFVVGQTNPEREKWIRDVPVSIYGLEKLRTQGLTTREDYAETPFTVDVKVSVPHSGYKRVDANAVTAVLDLTRITEEGSIAQPVQVSFSNIVDISLVSVSPSTLNVTVDRLVEKNVPVSLNATGELPAGLVSVKPVYPQTVTITGAAYYVEKISRAVADIDLSKLSDDAIVDSVCRFTDGKGDAIKFAGKKISVDMDVQTTAVLPVNTDAVLAHADDLAHGYRLEKATAGSVKVCGHESDLEKIKEIRAKPLTLTGKDASFTEAPLEFDLPEGITLAKNEDTPLVKLTIAEASSSVAVTRKITVSGLAEGFTASISDGTKTVIITDDSVIDITAKAVLTGPTLVLESLDEADVKVRLLLQEKTPGTYDLIPTMVISSFAADKVTAKLESPSQVSVTIQ